MSTPAAPSTKKAAKAPPTIANKASLADKKAAADKAAADKRRALSIANNPNQTKRPVGTDKIVRSPPPSPQSRPQPQPRSTANDKEAEPTAQSLRDVMKWSLRTSPCSSAKLKGLGVLVRNSSPKDVAFRLVDEYGKVYDGPVHGAHGAGLTPFMNLTFSSKASQVLRGQLASARVGHKADLYFRYGNPERREPPIVLVGVELLRGNELPLRFRTSTRGTDEHEEKTENKEENPTTVSNEETETETETEKEEEPKTEDLKREDEPKEGSGPTDDRKSDSESNHPLAKTRKDKKRGKKQAHDDSSWTVVSRK